jgi:hypothetical protein
MLIRMTQKRVSDIGVSGALSLIIEILTIKNMCRREAHQITFKATLLTFQSMDTTTTALKMKA